MNTANSYLKNPIVQAIPLKNEPILKLEYFEYFDKLIYNPIILRILLNSIHIFNYKNDTIPVIQDASFPISIQILEENENHFLVMHTLTEADILNELIIEKEKMFPDLDNLMIKKIDIKLEKISKENKPNEIHKNYLDNYIYKNACVKKFLSYFDENDILILPNLVFYIKNKYINTICSKIGIDCKDIKLVNNIKKNFGYNEIDLMVKFKCDYHIQKIKKDFNFITCKTNNKNIYGKDLSFKKDEIYPVEIKINSNDIEDKIFEGIKTKSNILIKSLSQQGFIQNISETTEITVIIIGDFSKNIMQEFRILSKVDINYILFYGDISINYSTFFYMSKRISNLENNCDELKKLHLSLDNKLKDFMEKTDKEILSLKNKK